MNSERDISEVEMGSFEFVNYGVRPNKAVERQLMFEVFRHLAVPLNLPAYRYLGFGALLFVDFVLAHCDLGINDLISIEHEANSARAANNAPFGCIRVMQGDSSVVLTNGSIDLREKPTLAWMDYDGPADESALSDLEVLCTTLPVGSFVIATVNALRKNYVRYDTSENARSLEESLSTTFGPLLPTPVPARLDSMNGFPPVVADMLMLHCSRVVGRARVDGVTFTPMFDFVYRDGTSPMVTIGGVVADDRVRLAIDALPNPLKYTGRVELSLPLLTPRERLALDRLLPSSTPLDNARVEDVLGFPLPQRLTESYRKLYRYYPSYSEVFTAS